MRPITPITVRGIRWMVLLLLSSTLALGSAAVSADHNKTCHPPDGNGGGGGDRHKEWINLLSVSQATLQMPALTVHFADDHGHPRVHGTMQVGVGTAKTVLVAEPGPATASCATSDGDGIPGLESLTHEFRDVRMGEIVEVTVDIPGGIGLSGTYVVRLVAGDLLTVSVEMQARVVGSGAPPAGRR